MRKSSFVWARMWQTPRNVDRQIQNDIPTFMLTPPSDNDKACAPQGGVRFDTDEFSLAVE